MTNAKFEGCDVVRWINNNIGTMFIRPGPGVIRGYQDQARLYPRNIDGVFACRLNIVVLTGLCDGGPDLGAIFTLDLKLVAVFAGKSLSCNIKIHASNARWTYTTEF